MYLRPINPDILMRQCEHRSVLIWSGGCETYFRNLQCYVLLVHCFKLIVRLPVD